MSSKGVCGPKQQAIATIGTRLYSCTCTLDKRLVCNYGKASLLRVPAPTGTRSYGKTAVPVVYSTASILYVQYVVDLRCQ